MRPKACLALTALLAALAAPAIAQPMPEAAVRVVGRTDRAVYFVQERLAAPAPGQIWMFSGQVKPETVSGKTLIGGWLDLRFDCDKRTLKVAEIVAVDTGLTEAFRGSPSEDIQMAAGSVYEKVFDYSCKGGPLDEGFPDPMTLKDAVALSQAIDKP